MDSDVESVQSSWTVTAVLAGGIIILAFVYNEWCERTLRANGLPGPRGLPIIGNLLTSARMGIAGAESHWSSQYGDVFSYRMGQTLNVIVKDKEILREIFVKDFANFTNRKNIDLNPKMIDKGVFFAKGSEWKRLRNILSPTFTAGKMKLMLNDINRCSRNLAEHLEQNSGDSVDVKSTFGAFTMDTIASTAFGIDVDSLNNPDGPFISKCRQLFIDLQISLLALMGVAFPWLCIFLKPLGIGFFKPETAKFFAREVNGMISERKRSAETRTDFLQLLMNAELDEKETSDSRNDHKKLTNEEICGQAALFFIAGYETTGSLLRYTAYELAIHQDIQDKILEEINEKLSDAEPNYDNVNDLRYMDQVLYETLRFYPPIGRINREAAQTRVFNGVTIPKGAGVVIPIFELQHDARFYDEPEEFRPERFEWKNSQTNNIDFLAFGFGPRICIGMRLAMLETKVALVHVLRKVRFLCGPDTEIPLPVKILGLTLPLKPVKVKVEKRDIHTDSADME